MCQGSYSYVEGAPEGYILGQARNAVDLIHDSIDANSDLEGAVNPPRLAVDVRYSNPDQFQLEVITLSPVIAAVLFAPITTVSSPVTATAFMPNNDPPVLVGSQEQAARLARAMSCMSIKGH